MGFLVVGVLLFEMLCGVFFEMLCGRAGYQDSLFVAALEMLCCGGYQDSLRASCAAARGGD